MRNRTSAFTLAEFLVALAVFIVVGAVLYPAFRAGLLLYSTNTGINVSHQQARVALARLTAEVEGASILPSLVDASLAAVSGTGPAAGVVLQRARGPYLLHNNQNANEANAQVEFHDNYRPSVGQRLLIPMFGIDRRIEKVTNQAAQSPPVRTLQMDATFGTNIAFSRNATPPEFVSCYIADRSAYVVIGAELREYPNATAGAYRVIASGITSARPFSFPAAGGGAPDRRYLDIRLSARDPRSGKRGLQIADTSFVARSAPRARNMGLQ
jgi:hypothetical protein